MGKNKSGLTLLFGLAAGAAAGYWLNSTKGKLWRKKMNEETEDIRSTMNDVAQDFSEMAKEKAGEFSSSVNDFASKAKDSFSEVANEVAKGASKASDLAQSNESGPSPKEAIKQGLKKAKEKLASLNGEFGKA